MAREPNESEAKKMKAHQKGNVKCFTAETNPLHARRVSYRPSALPFREVKYRWDSQ
jgi:hypothetical protein